MTGKHVAPTTTTGTIPARPTGRRSADGGLVRHIPTDAFDINSVTR